MCERRHLWPGWGRGAGFLYACWCLLHGWKQCPGNPSCGLRQLRVLDTARAHRSCGLTLSVELALLFAGYNPSGGQDTSFATGFEAAPGFEPAAAPVEFAAAPAPAAATEFAPAF